MSSTIGRLYTEDFKRLNKDGKRNLAIAYISLFLATIGILYTFYQSYKTDQQLKEIMEKVEKNR